MEITKEMLDRIKEVAHRKRKKKAAIKINRYELLEAFKNKQNRLLRGQKKR